jgi:hypothetical protein
LDRSENRSLCAHWFPMVFSGAGHASTPHVSSLRDSICVKSYPALPCRATDCPVPSGLIASGYLRFFSTPLKACTYLSLSSEMTFVSACSVVPRAMLALLRAALLLAQNRTLAAEAMPFA